MSDTVISVENLSKRYLIGHESAQRERYTALRDVIAREARNFIRKASDMLHGRQIVQGDETEEIWALRDINFEVKRGEVLGIIGRNGAGKSTLLKILSRITEPTEGRVRLRGRVGSLLEVGTGFHPELTGRENIYLNGAILGMTHAEIRRKFDEIVAFAEVEKFLDTPVKRYSSGMYVRLAFAVAAHLEPEILLVDEVLAVGDVEFQKKCIGKIDEVSRYSGRTVIFVSHNMEAILKLCTRGIFLHAGEVNIAGDAPRAVSAYLNARSSSTAVVDVRAKQRPDAFPVNALIAEVATLSEDNSWCISFGQKLAFEVWVEASAPKSNIELGIGLFSARGFEIASWTNTCTQTALPLRIGRNGFRLEYDDLVLLPGQYYLGIGIRSEKGIEDYVPEAVSFEVRISAASARMNTKSFGGTIVPLVKVSIVDNSDHQKTSAIC